MRLSFVVPAVPVAQPRHRAQALVRDGEAAGVRHYIPDGHPIRAFKDETALVAVQAMRDAGLEPVRDEPIILEARFLLPRPAWLEAMRGRGALKTRRWPKGEVRSWRKPDLDNLLKGLEDALDGICWKDDALVCGYGPGTGKWWHALGEDPRVEVSLWTPDEEVAADDAGPQELHEEDRR